MLDAQFEYCAANQPVVLTPFLLMGAMSPVTIPAALAQQLAEALSGIALAQLIRPGCPVIFGSFLSNIDMQSGSPHLRHPGVGDRAAVHRPDRPALRAAVPHRRRADVVPDARRAGGLRGPDDAAADLPGRHQLGHARGGLAGGRPGLLLREVHHRRRAAARCCGWSSPRWRSTRRRSRSARTRRSGHGGHFLGAEHTMERFRTCFYRPFLSSLGQLRALDAQRAARTPPPGPATSAGRSSAEYEQPPLDDAIRAELEEFVNRRRTELGD